MLDRGTQLEYSYRSFLINRLFCCIFFQASKTEFIDKDKFQSPIFSRNGKKKKKKKGTDSLNPQVRLAILPFFRETLAKGARKDRSLLLANSKGNERLFYSHFRAVRELHVGSESAESRVQKYSEVGSRQEQKPEDMPTIVILVPCYHCSEAEEERD